MKILLLPNRQKQEAAQVVRQAGSILAKDNNVLIFLEEDKNFVNPEWDCIVLPMNEAFLQCELVLTIGGDGTMLHAARYLIDCPRPLLGINIGRLGFLTLVEANELEVLRLLAKGRFAIKNRGVLCAQSEEFCCYALNDIVLFKNRPERTISMDIFCDEILVSRFRGDGIIFATPTGSTAYSMSAGGPILDARLQGIVVTQICAHIVHTPPLVVASNRCLRAVSTGAEGENVSIICDGRRNLEIPPGQEIGITQSDKTIPLVQFQEGEQLKFIDKKLKGR